ncbi:ribosome biogenesis GTP-binding protein YihA/YsxC [Rhodoblastus acidophilus]|uniref:Probable GTP-binding protein EngB n=1 Tax=Candidatus Rhodoblastus alkanivorans TaxID=2954117 RepID=A0ABS9ZBG7_9HYPH|nr:ribosome biogenesis GTP-binding protein YihA/YsxC [Candidatus Rhodoblastus alkanivorans]MCI4677746.1 ribosome biogenesis GTP-binding protein YihA/YsxC [Candidatus Rhodoblastus alkanivorans]MCI4684756.1 ribosome biogenesis GTP-binding protein YihA/YsxC [Candidatus Rhodoblastus alkanivorans]MDI4642079.1 ribosome biogenesis GTP-binding protein YihA/YsxC [Rhodoblastus acidophilus]
MDFIEIGRKLFAWNCEFVWAASKIAELPPMGPVEIAFAGRSNVGKSSLLNALTGRKTLARTSHTPGRTQQLNFFALGPDSKAPLVRLVDMPGYGYAAVSKEKIAGWTRLMQDFLRGRASLARVFVLVDGRHGLKDLDRDMLKRLDQAALSYQLVLTKRDEVKKGEIEKTIADAQAVLRGHPAAHPDVIFLSSHQGEGLPELRAAVARLLFERDRTIFEPAQIG